MKKPVVLAVLLALSVLALLLAPMFGQTFISTLSVLSGSASETDSFTFLTMRVPRVATAFLAGAGLSVSGMAFQAMFRNALATEYTLGVASGASLGASFYFKFMAAFSLLGISGVSLFAFAGAMMTVLVVYGISRAGRTFSTATMLLAGVAVSFFFSSIILLFQYISDVYQMANIVRWIMGGLEAYKFDSTLNVLPFVLAGSAIVFFHLNELNLLMTGDDVAASRGVDVHRTRLALFFGVSLMVGGVVAECGPIGFVGMMCPHICRLVLGADHRKLAPAAALFGGTFLVVCDTLGRSIMSAVEIPVGVITALLGGPFFVWLLIRGESEGRELI